MREISYREGRLADVHELITLALVSYGVYQPLLSPENWERLRSALGNPDNMTTLLKQSFSFVAVFGNRIVGMAFLLPHGNATDIYPDDWSYIRLVAVDPEWVNQGIATKLTEICIEKAVETGERTIALHTAEFMTAAVKVYERLGFSVLKQIPDRLGKQYWLYSKKL